MAEWCFLYILVAGGGGRVVFSYIVVTGGGGRGVFFYTF